jgi:hypothetical protein
MINAGEHTLTHGHQQNATLNKMCRTEVKEAGVVLVPSPGGRELAWAVSRNDLQPRRAVQTRGAWRGVPARCERVNPGRRRSLGSASVFSLGSGLTLETSTD